jgi:hypothetical protein
MDSPILAELKRADADRFQIDATRTAQGRRMVSALMLMMVVVVMLMALRLRCDEVGVHVLCLAACR